MKTQRKDKHIASSIKQKFMQSSSYRLSFVVAMMVFLLFLTNASFDLEPLTGIDYTIVSWISKGILFLLLLGNVRTILRKLTSEIIISLAILLGVFLVNFLIVNDKPLLGSIFFQFCLTTLPIIVVISCIDDYDELLSLLIWVSRIIAVSALALMLSRTRSWEDYNMGLANALTLPAVMLLWGAFRSGNVVDFILAIMDSLVIFILGSRGALLGIAVFFTFLLAIGCKRKDRRIFCIVIIACTCLALVFWRPILTWLHAFLDKKGFSSRTLNLLLSGDILFHDGRNPIYSGLRNELSLRPFAINGIGGERQFLEGVYAHSIIYELLLDFGVILGSAVILLLLYLTARTIVEAVARGDSFSMVKLIFLSVSLPIAFVSGTIWDSVYLWCWLVLCDKQYPAPIKRAAKASGDGKLLSIVIPTKNRYTYLLSFIELCATFSNRDFELVIQDNSDDNRVILEYLSKGAYDFVAYHYDPSPLSMSENSELAVQHAQGRYICFMGDDDLLSEKLVDFVAYMEQKDIDSAIFQLAQYNWPGVVHKAHRFPNLVIYAFDGQMRRINVKREYRRLLRTGAVSLEHMPQLYHGVVRRTVLDQVYAACGTYFPGPSPDMAVSVALSQFVKKHVRFNVPLISSGASPKSSAGLGARHMHKGELKSVSFLPKDIEEKWDERIPRVWTGPTIYAQSSFEALKASGREKDIGRFNFSYFLAFFDTFCEDYRELSKAYRKENKVNGLLYDWYRICIFALRGFKFVSNKLLLTIQLGGMLVDGVPNTLLAQRRIDEEIEKVPLPLRG